MKLNEAQEKAVFHKEGPMLVLAGPGSGKTRVITERTKVLIEQYGVPPGKILVITFTKAAAKEMKDRFTDLCQDIFYPVRFGTFHGIYFTILKYAYHYSGANILREDQKKQFFREILQLVDLEIEDENEFLSDIEGEIGFVKGERISLNNYYPVHCSNDVFRVFYEKYDEKLRSHNLIDFEDMLLFCYELLTNRKDILLSWQQQYEYILIDEFQDINQLQYDIIKLLSKPEDNLFIVGDDDQSIYRFRGAKPEIMLHFEKDYPNTKKVVLDINYRCSKKIVEAAGKIIKNNKNRFNKEIRPIKEDGEPIQIMLFPTQREENKMVVDKIMEYEKKGYLLSEMAVLFRTNTQPRALLEKMMEYNIPFAMRDNIPNMYEHWIARDLIAYIKIAMGDRDRGLFLKIMNRPKRYISRSFITDSSVSFSQLKQCAKGKFWLLERINKFEYDIKFLAGMNPYGAIEYIRKGIGYEDYLKEYAEIRKMKVEDLMDTLDEIEEAARSFSTYEDWFFHMEEYKRELLEQVKNQLDKDKDCVSMATMHSSKGLEYRVVFIIDANEGIMPHQKAILEADLEEERRMFYVAVTRAKEQLHIYSVKERYNKALLTSRYIGEMLLDKDCLVPGAMVEHVSYGFGVIKERKDGTLIIWFEKLKKSKKVDIEFCVNHRLLKIREDSPL